MWVEKSHYNSRVSLHEAQTKSPQHTIEGYITIVHHDLGILFTEKVQTIGRTNNERTDRTSRAWEGNSS